jgi:CYTH domain-containing protein
VGEEVERKFLVAALDSVPPSAGTALRQGYLAVDGDVEVRVRSDGITAALTVKKGEGLRRQEVEVSLALDDFDGMWPLTEGRRIEKVRRRVPVGAHVAEVDQYEGALRGLAVVEVEFASSADAEAFEPPPWFGAEVTGLQDWSNASLATRGRPGTAS